MYVKNNDFYFSKDDYLHFDKLKFTVYHSGTRRIVNRNNYDYAIHTISLHTDHGILVSFRKVHKLDKKIKLLITKDKHKNKMSLLYNLKCIISSLYNILLLCKQHVNIFKYDNKFNVSLHLMNEEYNKDIKLIKIYDTFMDLIIDTDNPTKQKNTILVILQSNINNMPFNQIIIENNVIRTDDMTIIHFESYNSYYNKIITRKINFYDYNDIFIAKAHGEYYISYYVSPSLLARLIDNIELFDNIDEMCVSNEHDLLKYI